MFIDFHIIYKAFLSRQLKFTDIHVIKKRIKSSPRLFLFFKISLKVKRRKNDTESPRVSGNFLLSVDDRDLSLERESVLARAFELLIGLLIGSNIFSRGEF